MKKLSKNLEIIGAGDDGNIVEAGGEQRLIITQIAPAVKNPSRVNVFVNGEYSFSLNLSQLVDFKLKIKQEISEEELSVFEAESEFGKLYQNTLEWIVQRPRSVSETRDFLRKKRKMREIKQRMAEQNPEKSAKKSGGAGMIFPENFIERIVAELLQKNYLNDRVFAENYVENRRMNRGVSQKRLRLELIKKGVSNEDIEAAISKCGRDDRIEIQKIITKKRRKYDDTKLIQYLVGQGFDFDLAKSAVDETD